ncbi:type II sulfide:quinone oxidoreductase Sqr [Staphylococcus aureus]|uniref:type II sulfide:quinone oxidoreductase Sqr n=1 Tax=Staphylococcus aureus TaxID=1280 RepID=UPI00053AAE73|nr:type II sulfide:quinone oxidoreductase Sqr [Staphylococcus aureus]HAR3071422.1 type II sulfide:quinone oxidoreductase Sqr [Staphylococcus aureus]
MNKHYQIVIIGGGTAGVTVASRLLRKNQNLKEKIAIIDPADHHYYQPLWTLVGAGVSSLKSSRKDMESVIPEGANWIKQAVSSFQPENNSVILGDNTVVYYDFLVVAPGLQINWSSIKGLKENIGKNGVCSNYSPDYVNETWNQISNFKQGNAIFTHPNTPIKCGGAPMKIMYLAEDYFRKHKIRSNANVIYATPKDALFDVGKYNKELERIVEERNITVNYNYNLVEIDGDKKVATFEHIKAYDRKTISYDMLHVTPPMGPLDVVKESTLSDSEGWVDVNPTTLQHKSYSNVFALGGDASNVPTSKTGAAIRKQAPIVANNLLQVMNNQMLTHHYDGYTSCPIVTGYNRLILAEFDYNKNTKETMPFNQAKERRSMYIFKKDLLPKMYWYGMLKGLI